MRRLIPCLAVALALLAACGGDRDSEAKKAEPSPLPAAYETCHEQLAAELSELETDDTADDYLVIDDTGRALLVKTADSGGEIRAMLTLTVADCPRRT